MGRSRKRKRASRPQLPDDELGRRLVRGAKIDMGDFVVSGLGFEPSYAEPVERVKVAIATHVPEELGFDPFGGLRVTDREIDDLVQEVDDWIRVGNHVRLRTIVGRTLIDIDGDHIMRTDHHADIDDPPEDWARRAARIIGDLRSHLDHIVFDLVNRAAHRPMTEEELERLSFPVDDPSRPQSMEKLRRKFPQLTDGSLTEILEAQPTRMPDGTDPRTSYMWMLNKLNNIQKHRTMNVAATGQVISRGPNSRVFGEGEILIPAEDIFGYLCEDGCVFDGMITYGQLGATRFRHDDGTVEPLVPLCRFLREAFAVVGEITCTLLETEGVLEDWPECQTPECQRCAPPSG